MSSDVKFWDRWAFFYTSFMDKNEDTYDEICEDSLEFIDPEMNVLELACGTGQITTRLCDTVKNYIASDYSQKMLDELVDDNPDCDAQFRQLDAHQLPYDDESFDMVIVANALHIMDDVDKVLDEIYRVLKKGGLLMAPTFVYDDGYSKVRIRLMELMGFQTVHKWSAREYEEFLNARKFRIEFGKIYDGSPLDECLIIARK